MPIIIIDYNSKHGVSCTSDLIKMWDDGTDALVGQLKGIEECKSECSKHKECGGFTSDKSTDICGNWHLGQVTSKNNYSIMDVNNYFEENKDCYSKHDCKYFIQIYAMELGLIIYKLLWLNIFGILFSVLHVYRWRCN